MKINLEIFCIKCNSKNLRKHGISKIGEQRYFCKDCHKTMQLNYARNGDRPEIKEQIKELAHNGCGVRQTGRILKISKDTVVRNLKKNKLCTSKS